MKIIFISLALITLSLADTSLKTRFKKCCSPGEVFTEGVLSKVGCAPTPVRSIELYNLDNVGYNISLNASGSQFGIPICAREDDIATTPLANVTSTDFLQESSCIEIFDDIESGTNYPLIVQCRSNEDREENKEPSLPLPRLLNIRRCCPKNSFFDEHRGICIPLFEAIPDGYFSDIDEFLSLLPKELDTLDFLNVSRTSTKCSGATFTYVIDAEDLVYVNGILQVTVTSSAGKIERLNITSENACLELTPDFRAKRRLAVRVCRSSDHCQNNACVRKCCKENGSQRKKCIRNYVPDFPDRFYETVSELMKVDSVTEFGLLVGLRCEYQMYMLTENDTWSMTPEGYIKVDPNVETFQHDRYCLETRYNSTDANVLNVFACFDKPHQEPSPTKIAVSNVLEAISCLFLLLTLLVYACLPTLQNLHGKTLMCHSASLLVAFACLAIIPSVTPPMVFDEDAEERYATAFCFTLGYIMLFAFLSAFCWLNVMCFDIWRTFGRLRGTVSRDRSHHKQFLSYCLYAWGLSLFITVFGILSDKMEILPNELRPNFGAESCWFISQPNLYGDLLFFRGPIAIQLTLNVVFFILTSERCSKVKAEIRRVADPSDPRSKRFHADKTNLQIPKFRFIMNVKLFIVMGISWIAEIISSFINQYTNYTWQEQIFYATDALNCLQGVLIFVLFVMKKRVYQALKKRLSFGKQKKGFSQGTSTLQDPFKAKMSASQSTLTSSFGVSVAP
nr:PREDICTED: G-protein coupled receptor Mth2 isoform X2 [Megachile rotundata]